MYENELRKIIRLFIVTFLASLLFCIALSLSVIKAHGQGLDEKHGANVIAAGITKTFGNWEYFQTQDRIQRPCGGVLTPALVQTATTQISIFACSGTPIVMTGSALTFNGSPIAAGGVTGSGTANTFPKFTSATAIGNSDLTTAAGGILTLNKSAWALPSGGGYLGLWQATSATNEALKGLGVYITNLSGNTKTGFAGEFSLFSQGNGSQARYALSAQHFNSGNVTAGQNYGLTVTMNNTGAVGANELFGASIAMTNSGGGTGAAGTALRVQYVNSNGTITEGRGLSISHHQNNTGTTTTYSALYIDANTNIGATTNYAIQNNSVAQNYFAGNIRLANNKYFQSTTTGAANYNLIGLDNTNTVIVGANGASNINLGTGASFTGGVYVRNGGAAIFSAGTSGTEYLGVTNGDVGISAVPFRMRTNNVAITGTDTNLNNVNIAKVSGSDVIELGDNTLPLSIRLNQRSSAEFNIQTGVTALGDVQETTNGAKIKIDDPGQQVTVTSDSSGFGLITDSDNQFVTIGDYNTSNNQTTLKVNDATQAITLNAQRTETNSPTVQFSDVGYQNCAALITNASGEIGCTPSDKSLKKNINPFTRGLSAINGLSPKTYTFENGFLKGETKTGFIAQDVKKLIPEAVSTTGAGVMQIDNVTVTATLVNAVKELSAQVEALKAEIAELKGAKAKAVKKAHKAKR